MIVPLEFWFGVVGFDFEFELALEPHPSSDPSRGVTGSLPLDESPMELAGEPLYPFPLAWWAGANGLAPALGLPAAAEGDPDVEGEFRFTSGEGGCMLFRAYRLDERGGGPG